MTAMPEKAAWTTHPGTRAGGRTDGRRRRPAAAAGGGGHDSISTGYGGGYRNGDTYQNGAVATETLVVVKRSP